MNDEIREILDILKKCKDYDDEVYLIKQHGATLLLDYITNLQKENDYYFKKNNELSTLNTSLRNARDDYKSKVEKAVELIKNKLSFETYQHLKKLYDDIDNIEEIWEDYEFEDLLNILQNGSDEE